MQQEELQWLSPLEPPFHVAGLAWWTQEHKLRRLPVVEQGAIREALDDLANNPAGGQIRFRTNAGKLAVKVRLFGNKGEDHITAAAVNGFDCYLGAAGAQKYVGTTRFPYNAEQYESVLFEGLAAEQRDVTLNLPLFQGIHELQIGLSADAVVEPPLSYGTAGKVIIYGTSITQGGCASRPGMAYSNILSRRFDREFINLGFSGNGIGDPEIARFISEIDEPSCVVLDYETNCPKIEGLTSTMPEFIRIIRERRAVVPILVVSRIAFGFEHAKPESYQDRIARMTFQRELVRDLQHAGDGNIHFCNSAELLGDIGHECTVDGIHLTDLGFMRLADGLTPILKDVLLGK